jgi:hypothetical protein
MKQHGMRSGHWTAGEIAIIEKAAKRTEWPWTVRKVKILANKLECTESRLVRQLRKMKLGNTMRLSACDYCEKHTLKRESGFCCRGARLGYRKCGVC